MKIQIFTLLIIIISLFVLYKKNKLNKISICIIIFLSLFLLILTKHNKQENVIDKYLKEKATEVITSNNTNIYIIDNFINSEECEKLIESSKNSFVKSQISKPMPDPDFRTSYTSHLKKEDKIQQNFDKKISKFHKIPDKKGEPIQFQYYKVGNQFKAHWDYFDPKDEMYKKDLEKNGQRTWTFMIYLNDVLKGGETEFVELNKIIKPKKGRAVIWNSMNHDYSNVNSNTKHRGIPVEKGYKYIITKWFRTKDWKGKDF